MTPSVPGTADDDGVYVRLPRGLMERSRLPQPARPSPAPPLTVDQFDWSRKARVTSPPPTVTHRRTLGSLHWCAATGTWPPPTRPVRFRLSGDAGTANGGRPAVSFGAPPPPSSPGHPGWSWWGLPAHRRRTVEAAPSDGTSAPDYGGNAVAVRAVPGRSVGPSRERAAIDMGRSGARRGRHPYRGRRGREECGADLGEVGAGGARR